MDAEPRLQCCSAVWQRPANSYTQEGSPCRRGTQSIAVWNKGINLELAKGSRGIRVKGSLCTREHGWPLCSRAYRWQQGRVYPRLPSFFLHQSVLSCQPGRFPPFWFPHEAVICTEVLLHSLGRGFGVLEQVPMCCCSSSWGRISSWSTGDPNLPLHRGFPPSDRFDPHLPARACRTVLVHTGTGGSHPAPFGVVKSVLSVLPSSHTVSVTLAGVK